MRKQPTKQLTHHQKQIIISAIGTAIASAKRMSNNNNEEIAEIYKKRLNELHILAAQLSTSDNMELPL